MAQKRTLAAAESELAALRAQLAAAGQPTGEAGPLRRFPCVMYHAAKVTPKTPNGYETRRGQVVDKNDQLDEAACEVEVTRLEQAGWQHTPESFVA